MEKTAETVLAVMLDESSHIDNVDGEKELLAETTEIEAQASELVIKTEADYVNAAEFGRELKRQAAKITDFFKPMKDAAHKAHKQVCDREKAMLEPLKKAEIAVKEAIGAYQMEVERKRREEEERLKRLAEAEADRKLEEAVEAEKRGDALSAEVSIEEASLLSACNLSVAAAAPKAEGVSTTVDYEIVAIDDGNVPISINGAILRPVDEKAVLKLIRQSNGTVNIPGVRFKEIRRVSIRR